MEANALTHKKKRSFLRSFIENWFGFCIICLEFLYDLIRTLLFEYIGLFKRRPAVALLIPTGLLFAGLIAVSAAAYVGYVVFDYTQYNPTFCVSCHTLMNESYTTWQKSVHKGVNCHTCHTFTPQDAKLILLDLVARGGIPDKIPARPHGKVLVKWQTCVKCHWQEDKEFTAAKKISGSRFHTAHYFMEQTECTQCHSYKLHQFTMEETHCVTCHQDKEEKVHGGQTEKVACLNCHTDRTDNLEPERQKCLYCHSDDNAVKAELARTNTLDARNFQPSAQTVQAAQKIALPPNAPMTQLACRECHKAHTKEAPAAQKYDNCLRCHPQVANVGEHKRHLELGEADCTQCHQPHGWRVSEEQAQTQCAQCHDYLAPLTFIGPQEKP